MKYSDTLMMTPCKGRQRTGKAHWQNVILYGTCMCIDNESDQQEAEQARDEKAHDHAQDNNF